MSDSESVELLNGSEKFSSCEPSTSISDLESSPDEKNSRKWNLGYYNDDKKVAVDPKEYEKKKNWVRGKLSLYWYNKNKKNRYYSITGTFLGSKSNFTDREATKIIKNGPKLNEILKKSRKQRKNGNFHTSFTLMQFF